MGIVNFWKKLKYENDQIKLFMPFAYKWNSILTVFSCLVVALVWFYAGYTLGSL
jgi:hypothetical protein